MFNILIVDDEEKITEVLKVYLEKEGYNIKIANTGKEAIDSFNKEDFDLIILDRMLPDISGESICEIVREKSMVHIIMLTAKRKSDDEEKIEGFNLGCDDYVIKPFNVKELVLRVKAVFRKLYSKDKILNFDDELIIDTLSHNVKVRGEDIILTNTEYKIILALAKNDKKLFTREELLEISGDDFYDKIDRTIDAHIKNLRQKLEIDTRKPKIIQTVYGVGYKFGL